LKGTFLTDSLVGAQRLHRAKEKEIANMNIKFFSQCAAEGAHRALLGLIFMKKKKYLFSVFISLIALPVSLNAQILNLSGDSGTVFARTFAYVYPDVARSVCQSQSNEIKKRLETALSVSGMLKMRESDICGDGVCLRVPGGERITRDPNALKEMVDQFRDQLIKENSSNSPDEQNRQCIETILSLEKAVKDAKGKKPEEILREMTNLH
jgi:hypothetical protein